MSSLISAVKEVIRDLNQLNAKYAIVGALAIGARGRTRQTVDADFAVAVSDDATARKLLTSLLSRGYGESNLYQNQDTGKLVLARLFAPEKESRLIELDFLFDLCGIEAEVVNSAEKLEIWPDVIAPVATISALIAMKTRCQELPERIQDKADLMNQLIPDASIEELLEAQKLISLMQKRGYNEGRDLLGGFKDLLTLCGKKV